MLEVRLKEFDSPVVALRIATRHAIKHLLNPNLARRDLVRSQASRAAAKALFDFVQEADRFAVTLQQDLTTPQSQVFGGWITRQVSLRIDPDVEVQAVLQPSDAKGLTDGAKGCYVIVAVAAE